MTRKDPSKPITLTAAHVKKQSYFALFPHWVSNGHWAIRRDLISNDALFASIESARAAFRFGSGVGRSADTDGDIDRILSQYEPTDTLHTFTVTPWLVQSGKTHSGLLTSGPLTTYLDSSYMALLGIEPGAELYARYKDGFSALTNSDRSFIVMPMRVEDRLSSIRSLIHLQDAQEASAA